MNDGHYASATSAMEATSPSVVQARYRAEREKRLRSDGLKQYVNLEESEDSIYRDFLKDPWDDGTTPSLVLEESTHFRFLILGAGTGGLLFATHLVDAGFSKDEIVIVDVASGFGGAWYWNRYPGAMCDVESYIYMPRLEESGYMPKNKYAYGEELREHSNRIARQWRLHDRAMFRTRVSKCIWMNESAEWAVKLTQRAPASSCTTTATVRADFVIMAPGLLNRPKMPRFTESHKFQGKSFLASRWDYEVTGGSQEQPDMVLLQDKKVGIVGTGASAIQAIPHLARCSKELLVFQRTPASIDVRGQKLTDKEEWLTKISGKPGWQMARSRNFASFLANQQPPEPIDLISDSWTCFPSFSVLTGGARPISLNEIPEHVANLHEMDLLRSDKIRRRVDFEVEDKTTAEQLKAWYPGWCKRPGFHDDYLQAFNRPNVKLVDTNGKGIQELTNTGVIADGVRYDVDVLIWSTGFELGVLGSTGSRCGVQIIGKDDVDMEEKWARGVATLHAVCTNGFPNMFFAGANQAGASPNYTPTLETFARHVAHIISTALKREDGLMNGSKVVIEPTKDAEEDWTQLVVAGAPALAPMAGCTPSYYNAEGSLDNMSPPEQMRAARAGPWPAGLNNFIDQLEAWRAKGSEMDGLDISIV